MEGKQRKTFIAATVLFAAPAACILPLPHCGRRVVVIDSSTASTSSMVRQPNTSVGPNGATVFAFDHGLRVLDPWWEKSAEEKRALRYGALGRITLRVVDSTGAPVTDADVTAHFSITYDDFITIKTKTDADGFASFQENTIGELRLAVMKDGHYSTTLTYWFTRQGFDCARDGRWIPWDPAVEIALTVAAAPGAAIAALRNDAYSRFEYAYKPPADGWITNATMSYLFTKGKVLCDEYVGNGSYWVVKTHDATGGVHHSIVRMLRYGPAWGDTNSCEVDISYYYNPNPNDTNLEYAYGPE